MSGETNATCERSAGIMLPLLLDGNATAAALGIGLSTLYAMDRSGELGPAGVKLRGRRLWPRRELERWVDVGCPHREKWIEMSGEGKNA